MPVVYIVILNDSSTGDICSSICGCHGNNVSNNKHVSPVHSQFEEKILQYSVCILSFSIP